MTINRNNYEELFLMYVDNELTQAQRADVEAFVEQNPDLSDELDLLKEAVLAPGDITFRDKNILYKDEHSININNYEEYFLLDVDNELSTQGKNEVEKFVLQHPALQDEYTLLHQTKLPVEAVEFRNKESLYRKEENDRRVIPMQFKKFAVAAAVIGLVATLWMVYPENNSVGETLASTDRTAVKQDKKVQPVTTSPTNEVVTNEETVADTESTFVAGSKKQGVSTTNQTPNSAGKNNIPVKEMNNQPEELIAYNNPVQQEQTEVAAPKEITNTEETGLATQASNKNLASTNASLVQPAVYKEAAYDEDEEDNSFYIGSAEINKNKLRGLLKKAANLFDKKSKSNDSDRTVQIASFEIKTK